MKITSISSVPSLVTLTQQPQRQTSISSQVKILATPGALCAVKSGIGLSPCPLAAQMIVDFLDPELPLATGLTTIIIVVQHNHLRVKLFLEVREAS